MIFLKEDLYIVLFFYSIENIIYITKYTFKYIRTLKLFKTDKKLKMQYLLETF